MYNLVLKKMLAANKNGLHHSLRDYVNLGIGRGTWNIVAYRLVFVHTRTLFQGLVPTQYVWRVRMLASIISVLFSQPRNKKH